MKHARCQGTSSLIENKIIDQVSYNVVLKIQKWHNDFTRWLFEASHFGEASLEEAARESLREWRSRRLTAVSPVGQRPDGQLGVFGGREVVDRKDS